jgi:signal transduction histidine kinase
MAIGRLKMVLPDQTRESLVAPLQSSAERGAEMVKQILTFARGVEGQRADLQLKHLLRDRETMLRHTLPKFIDIQTTRPKYLWTVSGDATQLYQVVMNLCVNVPRRWLRRSARKRLWCCPRDLGPERIRRVLTFQEMAGVSTEK